MKLLTKKPEIYIYALILIGAIASVWVNMSKPDLAINIYDRNYSLEVVETSAEKATGLSNHKSLCQSCGMLFVWEKPGIYNFWMKDMDFPIDIIWLNSNKEIIFIKENLSPDTFPNSYGTNLKSQYVLEFNAGFTKENKLKVGDRIDF